MTDCVSREAVIKTIYSIDCCWIDRETVADMVMNLPSVQLERPRGHWKKYYIEHTDNSGIEEWYECSECGQDSEHDWDFCHWCGADMRGDKE